MLLIFVASLSFVAQPADEDVSRHVDAYVAWYDAALRGESEFSGEAMRARSDAIFDELSIEELTAAQLAALTFRNGPTMRTSRRDQVKQRLASLAAEPTSDGASAAMTLVMVSSYDDQPEILAAAHTALRHEAIDQAIASGHGDDMFHALGRYIDLGGAKSIAADLLELHDDLPAPAEPDLLLALTDLVRMLANVVQADQEDAYHRLRTAVLQRVDAARATDERLPWAGRFLDGAYARLELFDHALPACEMLWSSHELTTLAPQGQVVVLEFFATWCTSCIAEFPYWQEFINRYDGYDVVFVSVSELEGWHYPAEGDRIDTSDDPELEFKLMRSFIRERNVLWPVAFVSKGYLTEQLGQRGIPTGFVIDARGIVREGTPSVRHDYEGLCRLVDSLLDEAGLPAPPPLP